MQWLLECSSAHSDFFAFPVPEGNVILDKVNLKYKFVTSVLHLSPTRRTHTMKPFKPLQSFKINFTDGKIVNSI